MVFFTQPSPWQGYICGLYFNVSNGTYLQKTFLPQVDLQAHATILATTSRTTLTQTFVNPSSERGIREVRYTFPLYDGVSVVGFTCHVGNRTIVGEVKEKEKARAVFKEAVARGDTAGLFEQLPEASDVFTTTVGNIPPGAKVVIEITYLGELKHDMEVDGIRYTIPNIICPRYGDYPGNLRTAPHLEAMGKGISITVDAEMADGSFIQKMQSPSHPISMSMGTLSSAPNDEPVLTKASATLTQERAELNKDFVIQLVAKNTGVPQAVLENHPTIPNHRALMATLVPKFALPPEKPELVFICDRSGSMGGTRITLVVQALKVFLKSLPVGVKFNICSFGSSYSFLWKKSVTYSQQTLEQAIQHVGTFSANYGGTEMLKPLKATIEQRYEDLPLDVMLLTDGEIWNQQELFSYLNKSVSESNSPIRIFTLGIGNGVSHALIEGVAKAGDGFSQTVGEGEKMDTKVVRMLKGALSPHIKDFTLEVNYSKDPAMSDNDDDFIVVEKVADSLKVQLDLNDKNSSIKQKVISLFDSSADPDEEAPPAYDETGESKYAHLPKLAAPKILQAPHNIPSLFAFNRTTAYLLLSPDAPQETPKSVVLRGTSAHGPLELEIPIQILEKPGETIHQLAAKKAISELEQGRGWLPEATTQSGKLVKSRFPGRFDDMVEREAVRLGVQFQVGGKWCSFVAVEKREGTEEKQEKAIQGWQWLEDEAPSPATNSSLFGDTRSLFSANRQNSASAPPPPAPGSQPNFDPTISQRRSRIASVIERGEKLDEVQPDQAIQAKAFYAGAQKQKSGGLFGGLFGGSNSSAPPASRNMFGQVSRGSSLFGSQSSRAAPASRQTASFGAAARTSSVSFGSSSSAAQQQMQPLGAAQGGASLFGTSSSPGGGPDTSSAEQLPAATEMKKYRKSIGRTTRGISPTEASSPGDGARSGLSRLQESGENDSTSLASLSTPAPNALAPSKKKSKSNAVPFTIDSGEAVPYDLDVQQPEEEQADSGSSPGYSPLSEQSTTPPLPGTQSDASNTGQVSSKFPRPKRERGSPSASNAVTPAHSNAFEAAPPAPSAPTSRTPEDLTHYLIGLQSFEGSWNLTPSLLSALQLSEASVDAEIAKLNIDKKLFVTALVVAFLEQKLKEFAGSWELVVDKARGWLADAFTGDVDDLVAKAGVLVH